MVRLWIGLSKEEEGERSRRDAREEKKIVKMEGKNRHAVAVVGM